ncbi:hypothetical protein B296_00005372 [Ensete ventricosum]|uniref:Trichome birefringence-like C-terminal domain-containing protein n=1 Tax=Ensete ventricosum TaxID=4639 RepID=A0A427B628_ENSVE|nr:hypothetical protein B296_00005372 [Ensete ventricosum]
MEMSVDDAYQRSIRTLLEWVHKEVNRNKTQVIFRTYAPVHFRAGNWKTGGNCHLETLPDLSPSQPSSEAWVHFLKPFSDTPSKRNSTTTTSEALGLDLLNVTQMTARRKDGHLSIFYLANTAHAPLHRQDCSHWCLPGVPDAWNQLLYALFVRREESMLQYGAPLRENFFRNPVDELAHRHLLRTLH